MFSRSPRIVDLSLPLRRGIRGFDWETSHTLARDGWNARTLCIYSHAGTHADAQLHFEAGPETIDRKPLEACSGRARVVELPNVAPSQVLSPDDLGPVAGDFERGDVLLLATRWSRHIDDTSLYRDRLPRIGEELARWCVTRGVRVLGVEPPSVADVANREEVTRIHHILLAGGVTIVEGLTRLEQLKDKTAWFMAAPLAIEGGDGAPCRAFALVPDDA